MAKKTGQKTAKETAKAAPAAKGNAAAPSQPEQVGFHKGSLMTLSKERQELMRILAIVEQLMQMHTAALKELGVDIDETQAAVGAQQTPKKPPIEDIL